MWDKHAIQIRDISYKKLYLEVSDNVGSSDLSDAVDAIDDDGGTFRIAIARTEFDDELNRISVKIKVQVGYNDDSEQIQDECFWLEVEVEGHFQVDPENFPLEKLELWASQNAPLTLYPYAREAVHSLSSRAMPDSAIMLPLLVVPSVSK